MEEDRNETGADDKGWIAAVQGERAVAPSLTNHIRLVPELVPFLFFWLVKSDRAISFQGPVRCPKRITVIGK